MMRAWSVVRPAPMDDHPLELSERPAPEPAPDEILVRVRVCGVCRTDLHLAEGDLTPRGPGVVPGHQVVGVVEQAGESTDRFAVGDRVGIAWLRRTCGSCQWCRRGAENLCPTSAYTGWDADGGFAEYAVVPAAFAYRVPEAYDDVHAAPLLCAGIIGYRSLRISGIRPGQVLGLFGFGSSAHLAIQVARHWGCPVAVFARSDAERQLGLRLGASWAGGYDDVPPVPLDAAVTFAPVGSVVVAALAATAPGGTVAINAIHLDRMPEFSYDLLWKERSLRSVANFTRRDAREFLELAAAIPIQAETTVFSLDDAPEALARLEEGAIRGSAVLDIAGS